MRFSKPMLMDFAKKMGIVGITKSTKKIDICKKISMIINKNTTTFKNTNKNKNVKLSGSNNDFRINKTRCGNYSKSELLRIAKILKITLDPKDTRASLCKKIEKMRNAMIAPKPKAPPAPPKKIVKEQKIQQKTNAVMKKRGLNAANIRKDIIKLYGKKWMDKYKPSLNNDVRLMTTELGKLKGGNKSGIPFKKNIDRTKKNVVNRWKRERFRDLEKKAILNSLNTNGIPKNMINAYKLGALNYIMIHKPTKQKLLRYKKTWLSNAKNTKGAKPTALGAKAKIEIL